MCFGTGWIVLCKSLDVERVEDAGGASNTGGKEKGGVGGKKGYIYSSSGNFSVQGSTCEFFWLTNTKRPCLHLAELPGNS